MEILSTTGTIFDSLRRLRADGAEYWSARDLQAILGYEKWQGFTAVLERSRISCDNNQKDSRDHFIPASKMVEIGSNAEREVLDYQLTRYACYLTAMNGDPKKQNISAAQDYFAGRARESELREAQALALSDDPILAQLQVLAQVRQNQLVLERRTSTVEQATAEITARLDASPIDSAKISAIYKLGRQLGTVMGDYSRAWRMIKDHYNLASYRDLPSNKFEECERFIRMQIAAYTGSPLYEGQA